MRKLSDAFAYAIIGLGYAVRTQRTLRIHLAIAVVVGLLLVWLELPALEAAVVILAIVVVITTELLNTGVEAVVDLLVERNHHELAKMAKDIAAGAVLVTALGAAIVGVLLLGLPLGVRVGLAPALATQVARVAVVVLVAAGIVIAIRSLRPPRRSAHVPSSDVSRDQ